MDQRTTLTSLNGIKLQWDTILPQLRSTSQPTQRAEPHNPSIASRHENVYTNRRPLSQSTSGAQPAQRSWFPERQQSRRDRQVDENRPRWSHLRTRPARTPERPSAGTPYQSGSNPDHLPDMLNTREQEQADRQRQYSRGQYVSFRREGQGSQSSLSLRPANVREGPSSAGQGGQIAANSGFQPLSLGTGNRNMTTPEFTAGAGLARDRHGDRRQDTLRTRETSERRTSDRRSTFSNQERSQRFTIRCSPTAFDSADNKAKSAEATRSTESTEALDVSIDSAEVASNLFEESVEASSRRRRAEMATPRREQYRELFEGSENRDRKKKPRHAVRSTVAGKGHEEKDWDKIDLKKERKRQRQVEKRTRPTGPQLLLPDFISIGNLATALKIRAEAFAPKLQDLGFENLSNDYVIDAETAGLIASEFGFNPILPSKTSDEDLIARPPLDDESMLLSRPPVITIMGHVDHGKTTLLDWLRKSSVAASEYGGITQHIGAFTVQMPSGRIITFLDTPGHEAFLDMRARGANVTDIVILVVAADDSVKPQTIEAIKHAKAAKVPIIVAITKVDKEDANPERVKQDLARQGIEVEDFGGETQTVCVSGKTGQGMEDLEDAAIALADILDVKADTTGEVEGWILEASQKKSGKVATVLVRRGTLSTGNILVAGKTWTRVRTLRNEAGIVVQSATPGTPVEVDGWREQPEAGSEFLEASDEQRARRVVDFRTDRGETQKLAADVLAVNEARRAEEEKRRREDATEKGEEVEEVEDGPKLKIIPFILRADVSGSVEALQASVLALGNSEVRASVLRAAVGSLAPSDIEHAATAKGHVISFNCHIDGEILRIAGSEGVKIVDGNVIYRVVNEVKAVLEESLPPNVTSRVTGEAEIAQVFEIKLKGKHTLPVAGCKVRNGTMTKGSKVKILRNREIVYEGVLNSLKNQKKDVTEMRKGTECGLGFENFQDFQAGDQVQCYETHEERRSL